MHFFVQVIVKTCYNRVINLEHFNRFKISLNMRKKRQQSYYSYQIQWRHTMKNPGIVNQMALEDKIAYCSGDDFWHTKAMEKYSIPSIMVSDGPHGLRKQVDATEQLGVNKSIPATCFPAACATACSWDTELLGQIGDAIAKEAVANGVSIVLGPGVCIKRNPLCGRNFEYFSEDPYLAGKLGANFIEQAQKNGIGTSLKHFACNNQEYKRFSSNSILDERTLREIYLTAFEIAVKEGKPETIMCAYNKINGTYCSDNSNLLTKILRDEWGYEGMVITDWGAMSNRIKGFRAGCDLVMPGGSAYMEKESYDAVKDGQLDESFIDQSVDRILTMVLKSQKILEDSYSYDVETHHHMARYAAEQSAVLLKNIDHILPIKKSNSVGIIGYMAKELRYQGSGSSHINPTKIVNPLEVMSDLPYAMGCDANGNTTDDMIEEAITLAEQVHTAIVFAGLTDYYESEGYDREHMRMPLGHVRMIEAVANVNPNTVVVLMCGCPVEIPWEDQVKGILYMALPGQAGGEAIANLLYGKVVPCGKLAETWPIRYEDCISSSYYGEKDAYYREGIYVGYRYYEKAGAKVRYPFGYGLSYTSFQYSNLVVKGNKVTVDITNTGNIEGSEIVQLYIAPCRHILHRPIKELKGFTKLTLKPWETKQAEFWLNDRSFSLWDKGWKVLEGRYKILIGSSSANILLEHEIEKEGVKIEVTSWQPMNWYESLIGVPTKREWERILGYQVFPTKLIKGQFTMENTVLEMKEYSFLMKLVNKYIVRVVAKEYGGTVDFHNPVFLMYLNMAVDSSLSGLKINNRMKNYVLEGLLAMANGHYFKGLKYLLKKI